MSIYNSLPLTRAAKTMLDILKIEGLDAAAPGLPSVEKAIAKEAKGPVNKAVIYNADAIGMYIIQKYTELFYPVFENTCTSIPMLSTVQSVTPVAHASMYTGLDPKVHGIQTYTRPKLECETVYDVLIKQGRHPAIICMTDSSFAHIFSGRPELPIFEEKDNEAILKKAEELLAGNKYDFISIHTFEYDDAAHAYGPESKEALDAAKKEALGFDTLCKMIEKYWKNDKTLVAYMPDHGQHLMEKWEPDADREVGNHGSIKSEDMNLMHYYGIVGK